MARTVAALAATALLTTARGAEAASCVVVGGPQAPVEVRIYESNPYAAPAGKRLFIGLLNRGERHRIANRHGSVWYAFRWHEGDVWREGYETPCRDDQVVELP
jgi:hypothetical protein